MKKIIIILISIFICSSCGEWEWDESPRYYQFTQSNYEYIPTIYSDIGKTFKFKNQLNEEVIIEVLRYKLTKEKAGGYFTSSPLHYYQNLEIELKVQDEGGKTPNCDLKRINFSNANGSYFVCHLLSSRSPDPCSNGSIPPQKFEFPLELEVMNINGVNYNKVISVFENNEAYFSTKYTFNKVYFDFKQGFIGFDDTENNVQFRIVKD
ncbi:hypothetical protein [Algibacter sp. 2305UL17-15]|uniref:hypothetical protein n=1 Tax=Algibacter sp. 2305UL17-15 TaxID=3231268 RepID=UPI0034592729